MGTIGDAIRKETNMGFPLFIFEMIYFLLKLYMFQGTILLVTWLNLVYAFVFFLSLDIVCSKILLIPSQTIRRFLL